MLLPDIKAERSGEEGLTTAAQGTLEDLPLRSEGAGKKASLCACSEKEMYSAVFIPQDGQEEIMGLPVASSSLR